MTALQRPSLTFRRAQSEQLRQSFRYDWDGNRRSSAKVAPAGGALRHQGTVETLLADMAARRPEFRTKTAEFSREMQLEALAALLNFDDVYRAQSGSGTRSFGETNFAGGRNDDRAP